MMNPRTTIETTISGIPCLIEVERLTRGRPARIYADPEDCWPEEGGEIEYRVLDRKGYVAPWLANKVTDEDEQRIYEEASDILAQPPEV